MIAQIFSFLMILLLRIYKLTLSPVFGFFGVRCRHEPTCSSYGIAAIRSHGPWTGGWLTLSRLLRCHPFGSHGLDPVPVNRGPRGKLWQIGKLGDWSWSNRDVKEKSQNRKS
ncbi:Protein YidD [hydrothermal vent metagenome]|uniref:Protein YidD n=1 Tax=hydrothermal vent metagenome TaxID=652676 RepID=A0A3B0R1F7_9ZZZZ